MSTIFCLLVIVFSPMTWLTKWKHQPWVHWTAIILNASASISFFIEGKWGFGLLWAGCTLMWVGIMYMNKLRKRTSNAFNELSDELRRQRDELLRILEESRDELERCNAEIELKKLEPRKGIKKFKF